MSARPGVRLQALRATTGRGLPLPTGRGSLLLFLGVVLYAAGANVSSGWTLLVASACLGALGWSWLAVRRAARVVTARRTLPAVATAGLPVATSVEVSAGRGVSVLVADPATGLVGVVDRGSDRVDALVTLRRGHVGGGEVVLRVTDPLGLVAVWRRRADATAVLVLPSASRLLGRTGDALRGVGGLRDGGAPSPRRDLGPELVGLRDHQQGDALAAVHWRASARRGELVTRDARQPRQERRDLVLAPGEWDADRLDLGCAAVVELAEQAATVGQPVTVCADGVRLPWGAAARAHLATLPPAAGITARPLATTDVDPRADVVRVTPTRDGVEVRGPGLAPVDLPLEGAA